MEWNSIKTWAEEDRPREKLSIKGKSVLSDAELLAIILGSGTKRMSALELAREILIKCENNLIKLAKMSVNELCEFNGIGPAKAISIVATMELSRRKNDLKSTKRVKITSSNSAFVCLKPLLTDLSHEEFYLLLLDRSNSLLKTVNISKGGISGTVADGKLIFNEAISHKASGIILAHNHPSGQLKPSEQDIILTRSLKEFGKMIDLLILDHLILTDYSYFSFADEGLI